MDIRNSLSLALRNFLSLVGLRLVRLSPNKVRGIEPVLDLKYLLRGKSNPTIVDVGANDGETVSEFLKCIPGAKIIAFEPFEQCYRILQNLFSSNPDVRIENVALGCSPGSSNLNVYSGNRMNSLLELDDQPGNVMRAKFTAAGTTTVAIETLDDFCRANSIGQIDVLKIDTQGFDLNVLKGAVGLLQNRRVTAIQVEVNFIPMYKGQPSFLEIHKFLSDLDYRLVDFYNQTRPNDYTAWCDACYVLAGDPGRSR